MSDEHRAPLEHPTNLCDSRRLGEIHTRPRFFSRSTGAMVSVARTDRKQQQILPHSQPL